MAGALKPISQNQSLITISEISDVTWTSKRGAKVNRAEVAYNDNKTGQEKAFVGFVKIENMTLTKTFEPANDRKVIEWCQKQLENPTEFNVSVQPVKADLAGTPFEGAPTMLYSGCQLKSYSYPDFDRASTGLAMLEIEVIVNSLPSLM